MLSAALGRHGARSGAVPEPPQTCPAAFGRIWDEVRRLREALELQNSVLEGSGKVGIPKKILFWRVPGGAGITKIVCWRAPGGVGSTKIVVWRSGGRVLRPTRWVTGGGEPTKTTFSNDFEYYSDSLVSGLLE